MKYVFIFLMMLSFSGCGLETAGTAATGASIKKQELEEGKKTMDRAQYQIKQFNQTATGRVEKLELDQNTSDQ